jgi:hypothetical protein
LFFAVEHRETEALAVSRIYPIPSNESSGSLHFGQDTLGERGGCGWRLRGVNRQMNKCCVGAFIGYIVPARFGTEYFESTAPRFQRPPADIRTDTVRLVNRMKPQSVPDLVR